MTAPGTSAESEFRIRRRRRLRIRAAVLAAGAAAAAAGTWALRAGRPGTGGVLWAVAAGAGLLLSRPWFGGRDVSRWSRGAAGERRSAEILAGLPGRRWVVRHDLSIPGSRANIDHVVVGRTGVWVIDTKTTRAPVTAGWRRVYFGDRALDTASVRWEADVLGERLGRALVGPDGGGRGGDRPAGHRQPEPPDGLPGGGVPAGLGGLVRPLVAVHGEGLRRRGGRAGGVPVVPAGRLTGRIRRGRRRLRRAEIRALGRALDRAFPPGPGSRGARSAPVPGRAGVGAGTGSRDRGLWAGRSHG
ncbi:MAG TPA: nuclease-related domain-containing protein [Acidimicrobiales bacterium]|nr:nuclease-related domain-containing protein [Acidimicrobiales bacterium]